MKERILEPSTWAGLATIAQAAKYLFPGAWWLDLLTAVAGAVAVKLPERAR